jgi:MerR family transcriptional regulator/heat shock protein HspR
MRPRIIPREQVARNLAVSPAVLVRYEARGLVRSVREGDLEGYEPSEVRRVWTVLSLHRDAGINLAGIEAILRLRERLDEVHGQLRRLASEMRQALEADLEAEPAEPDPET